VRGVGFEPNQPNRVKNNQLGTTTDDGPTTTDGGNDGRRLMDGPIPVYPDMDVILMDRNGIRIRKDGIARIMSEG
jgi:hypothetical protein